MIDFRMIGWNESGSWMLDFQNESYEEAIETAKITIEKAFPFFTHINLFVLNDGKPILCVGQYKVLIQVTEIS